MLAGELCSSKLRREAGCWERKKQSSSKSSCAGMPEDLANMVWGTGSDSLQLGSCYSVFGAALHCSTCPPLQDTIERPSVCLNTLLSLWSPDLMLHVFFFFPFFPQITGFCTVWEPQLHYRLSSADAGHCTHWCRALFWRLSPLLVAAKWLLSILAASPVLCKDDLETGCSPKSSLVLS